MLLRPKIYDVIAYAVATIAWLWNALDVVVSRRPFRLIELADEWL